MSVQKKSFKRNFSLIIGVLFLVVLGTGIQPQKARADLPVADFLNFVKNTATAANTGLTAGGTNALVVKGYTLDPLAFAVSKAVLNSLVQSTVKWINSGFNGSPAFVTNLNATLLSVANSTADSFTKQLLSNGSIKSPFQNSVGTAVASNYNTNTNGGFFAANPYTLNKTVKNDTAFINGDFSQGGFDGWFSEVMNPANNSYGAYEIANSALGNQVSTAQKNQSTELNWGKGFLSFKGNCNSATTKAPATGQTLTSLAGNTSCAISNILTPGAAIESQLEKTLGSGIDQLVTANQFNEIVNALVGQLTKQVLGSGGLAGLSQPSSSSGSSYLDQITASQAAATSGTVASLSSSFSQTITNQITQLQQFQTNWNTINSAALAARVALTNNTCSPNAQQALATVVQPAITQAATELSAASASISALTKIQTEAAATNSTTAVSQASADYSTLLASNTLPSASDLQTAITQSTDTGAATVSSLYTQLVQITNAATTCQPLPAFTPST